ncbi:cytochrome c [Priestia flexa]|jgi:cytochrome c551|uniref:Cytochrome c n=1 Tax=Priestia flexa TaxID=86664 RepID=A0A1N6PIY3_9BACI|nr:MULTISPECIES: cytochrome c [Bacillaceae]AQX53236.1 cytochrome C551 [Priestia flexa]KZB91640.1 cytochrome C551 [Bacillus sp. VT 712]MBN8252999.1 cytochrome c [Priestia flexa]MBN8433641.1 cytochrome c [Priestia flexa]MBY6086988.1 cytochrome c [Priestia flexa]
MKKLALAIIAGASFTLAACGGGNESSETASEASGEELYQQNCSGCHGQNLEGARGPNLEKTGAKYSQEEIEDIINNGKGSMPKGLVNEEEASKIAEWLAEKK